MKNITIILFILFVSCQNTKPKENIIKAENMDWILGNWIRINDKEIKSQTFEDWTKISNTEYKGHGYVKQNESIVWEEHIRLFQENNEWIFEVTGVNETPTNFKIVDLTDTSFTSENLENDFPTHIKYYKEYDLLKAKVYDNEQEIDFEFEKR